jgi:Family of unknown function (DUF6476)
MIGAVITVVGLLVTRMPSAFSARVPHLPAGLTLPEGQKAAAVTFGTGWIAVVTKTDHILIFGENGTLLQDFTIPTPPKP